jgi:hypothetical protein
LNFVFAVFEDKTSGVGFFAGVVLSPDLLEEDVTTWLVALPFTVFPEFSSILE